MSDAPETRSREFRIIGAQVPRRIVSLKKKNERVIIEAPMSYAGTNIISAVCEYDVFLLKVKHICTYSMCMKSVDKRGRLTNGVFSLSFNRFRQFFVISNGYEVYWS